MATEITMPKLSDTMEEGTILRWHVKEGDRVSPGDIIAEVETDKAAMEMEAFEDGVVSALKVPEGETVAVGTLIAVLDGEPAGEKEAEPTREKKAEREKVPKPEKGKEAEDETKEPPREEVVPEKAEAKEKALPESEAEEVPGTGGQPSLGRGVTIAPAARKLAREKGISLRDIRGTGPGGRVIPKDVERAATEKKSRPKSTEPGIGAPARSGKGEKAVKIRRIVARKMVESWQNVPHFFVTVAVDMTDIIRFRKDVGVSINDFILTAAARSLRDHPWVNSHWEDGQAVEQESIDICMAVATENGLFNPVIRDCGKLSLREIHRRGAELADKAHRGKLSQADLEGGTFTVSNMGMLGVESFSAIITPPQAAVLAVGTIKGEVVVKDDAEPGVAPILRITLSADHRMLDGADAAEFLATLKSYLEAPITLITGEAVH